MNWTDPAVTLDAAALLPPAVGAEASRPSRFTATVAELLEDVTSTLMSSDELRARVQELATIAAAAAAAVPFERPDAEASADATARRSGDLRPSEVEERIRYDEHFGVRRVDAIEAATLAGTTFACLADALADLADAQISLTEVVALLRGVVVSTGWIDDAATEVGPFTQDYRPGDERALRRFRLGHLVFALMCDFGYYHLRLARALLETGEAPVEHLDAAAICVRASTAAMWYSTCFPQAVYLSTVRPPMDRASRKDHGFSGLDNFDFRRMRESWEDLVPVLSARLSENDEEAPLRTAAHRLYETIVEDNEHHILIAAEALGMAPSLKLERMAGIVPGAGGIPAVAALRLNAEERKALLSEVMDA